MALRDAGIECKIVSREEGLKELVPGQVVFCVMARNSTNEPNRMVAASIGCAVPADGIHYGYLSEYHAFGANAEVSGHRSEDLAVTMLATSLGMSFDPEKDWDEREDSYKMSGKSVRSSNVTKTAEGDKTGLYTTVIAAAVFIADVGICDSQGQESPKESYDMFSLPSVVETRGL